MAAFPHSLSVLKIYNVCDINYKFSELIVNMGTGNMETQSISNTVKRKTSHQKYNIPPLWLQLLMIFLLSKIYYYPQDVKSKLISSLIYLKYIWNIVYVEMLHPLY